MPTTRQDLGDLVAEARRRSARTGHHGGGVKSPETAPGRGEGISSTAGTAALFRHDPERMETVVEDALILIYEKKLSGDEGHAAVLSGGTRRQAVVIVAEDVEGGRWPRWWSTSCGALTRWREAPGFGDRRKASWRTSPSDRGPGHHRRSGDQAENIKWMTGKAEGGVAGQNHHRDGAESRRPSRPASSRSGPDRGDTRLRPLEAAGAVAKLVGGWR